MSNYIEHNSSIEAFNKQNETSWSIISKIEQRIKNKIENAGIRLSDWDIEINYGIKTGYNEAFIISNEERERLLTSCATDKERELTDELIRPILRGKDIKKYRYDYKDLYVILAYFGSYKILPIKYPTVFTYLSQFKSALEARGQCRYTSSGKVNINHDYLGQHHWLELDNNPSLLKLEDFSKQKIVWGNLNLEAAYTIVDEGIVIAAPSCMLLPANKYILAVLNSKVADFYVKHLGVARNGGFYEYKPMFVEQIPIPHIDQAKAKLFDTLVTDRIKGQNSEKLINNMIFDLYGLTQEDVLYLQQNY
ncbi:MAG: hypothetical protein LKM33_01285 [Bacteroidales bacterium]|nr:hypothetical protein [Bacteroidales bacterium]